MFERRMTRVWLLVLVVLLTGSSGWAVCMEWVFVGDPGNAADTEVMNDATSGYGSVGYEYYLGKYEVTAGQYTEFLNAIADSDPTGLYNPLMWSSTYGCKIERSGSSGSYSYSIAGDRENRPVNYVGWYDALRFCNWMHNGQPTGTQDSSTTEDGAYTFSGATSVGPRNPDAKVWLPSEDEWYKAAFYKGGGLSAGYWDYPTQSDSVPSNDLIDPDPGNNANYWDGDWTIGSPYYLTEVGEFENSVGPYGTLDQAGNVWEWNESLIGSYRGLRGNAFNNDPGSLHASFRHSYSPTDESITSFIGFRIARLHEAEIMEYTDETTFTNSTGTPEYLIDFESYGDGTPVDPGDQPAVGDEWVNLGVHFDEMEIGYSMVLSAKAGMNVSPTGASGHALATAGLSPGNDRSSRLISFLTPVTSFGVYVVDNETTSSTERIILRDVSGNVIGDFAMPGGAGPAPPIAHDFIGYSSTVPIAEVLMIEANDGEGALMDNVMFSVPESAGPDIDWVYINDPCFAGYMGKYEITNEEYCEFLNAALASGDITISGNDAIGANGSNSGADFVGETYYDGDGPGLTAYGATNGGQARINYAGRFSVECGFENHPVTYVSWYGAKAFCNYYGYRLPTEWEWQAVADYDGSYTYGCGTGINTIIANYRESTHPDGTTSVGSFGTYGYGMCDMAGNLREWTDSWISYPGCTSCRVLRDGSWINLPPSCEVSYRDGSSPHYMYHHVGFRVVKSATYYVNGVSGSDSNDGLTPETAFATIQKGIDTSWYDDEVLVYPAIYAEEVEALGKVVTVRSLDEPAVITAGGGYALSFLDGEDANTVFENFIITGSDTAIGCWASSPALNHLTVVDNNLGVIADEFSEPIITNSIFWNNRDGDLFGCSAEDSFFDGSVGGSLVSYWQFDEGGGGTAYDSIGGNDGSISGAAWATGQAGGALDLDGTDDYVAISDSPELDLVEDFTLQMWVKRSEAVGRVLMSKHYHSISNDGSWIFITDADGRMQFAVLPGADPGVYSNPSAIALGQWEHVVFTYRESDDRYDFYVNGVSEGGGIAGMQGDIQNTGQALYIGRIEGDSSAIEGLASFDEVMIFDRALSAVEVESVHHVGLTGFNYGPLFADANGGDYRLKSERGRYWGEHGVWVLDDVSSPCLDIGDSFVEPVNERMPNGGRINIGAYGNTSQASMSEWPLSADENYDGRVNFVDFAMGLGREWLSQLDWVE